MSFWVARKWRTLSVYNMPWAQCRSDKTSLYLLPIENVRTSTGIAGRPHPATCRLKALDIHCLILTTVQIHVVAISTNLCGFILFLSLASILLLIPGAPRCRRSLTRTRSAADQNAIP